MLEYILALLLISAILMFILYRLKNHIPLPPKIIYCSVGISFILGAFFPALISTLTPGGVVIIYFTLIILSAIALCLLEKKMSLNCPEAFEQFSGSDLEAASLYRNEAAFETCATQDYTMETEHHTEHHTDAHANDLADKLKAGSESVPDTELEIETGLEPGVEVESNDETELETETEHELEEELGEAKPETEPEPFFKDDKLIAGGDESYRELTTAGDMPESEAGSTMDLTGDVDLNLPENIDSIVVDTKQESQVSDAAQLLVSDAGETGETDEIHENNNAIATINDYVSAGFNKKSSGDLAGAIELFYKSLELNNDKHFTVTMVLEISAVYQDLGQYQQAGMIISSVMNQKEIIKETTLMHELQSRLTFLKILVKLLEVAKMPGAPYSKIPNFIKIKANLEAANHIKELT